jgi:hypothetical protein
MDLLDKRRCFRLIHDSGILAQDQLEDIADDFTEFLLWIRSI